MHELLPELLSTDGRSLYSLGQGLADGCTQPEKLWSTFSQKLALIDTDHRNYHLLQGFLNGISNRSPDVANKLLDNAVKDIVLGKEFLILQTSVPLDDKAVERVKLSLENDTAPIRLYRNLVYGRGGETLSDEDLCHFLRLISSKPDGEIVAIKIFSMRLHRNSDEEPNVSSIIATLGQELVLNHQFLQRTSDVLEDLGDIIELCFMNDSAANTAKKLCEKLARVFTNNDFFPNEAAIIQLKALAITQPSIFLDGFLGDEIESDLATYRSWLYPLPKIDDEFIIEWCEENPVVRYPRVAVVIEPYQAYYQDNRLEWTPLAKKIIDNSPEPILILNQFKSAPMIWLEPFSELMQKQLRLITELKNHENCSVAEWAISEEVNFKDAIASEIKRESAIDERFE